MQDKLKLSKVESQGYGVIYKMPMLDRDLDVVAKAFYAYLCSYAGAGDTAFPGMDKICHDLNVSRQRLERHRKALVDKGYITINQVKGDKGRFSHNEYIINKTLSPLLQKPTTDEPTTDYPTTENVTTNNNIFNNNSINNNSINIKDISQQVALISEWEKDFNEFWSYYPKKSDKAKAKLKYKAKHKKDGKDAILNGLLMYLKEIAIKNTDKQYIKNPTTFLNAESYNNEFEITVNDQKKYNNQYQKQDAMSLMLDKFENGGFGNEQREDESRVNRILIP